MDIEVRPSTAILDGVEETVVALVTLVAGIIALFLMAMHSFRTWQDMCTPTRESVSRRSVFSQTATPPPQKTVTYTLGAYLKHFAILFYGVALVAGAVTTNFWPRHYGDCFTLNIMIVSSWQIALTFHHLVYIAHLQECYPYVPGSDRPFGFKVEKSACLVVVVLFFGFFWTIYLVATSARNGILEQDADDVWPFHCDIYLEPDPQVSPAGASVLVLGLLMLVWQFCLSAGSFYSFARAFAQFSEWLERGGCDKKDDDDETAAANMKQILYTGYKFKTIVGTQAVSTFVWILLALLNLRVFYKVAANIAWLISMVSLMLLTPYYRNEFWFKWLCCPCTLCDSHRVNYVGKNAEDGVAVDVHYLFSSYAQQVEKVVRKAKDVVENVELQMQQQTGQGQTECNIVEELQKET